MRTPSMIRNSLFAAGLMVAFAAVPVSQVMAQDSTGSSSSTSETGDAWITTKVKSEFTTTKGISSTDISVTTTNGVVTLTGTATSKHEKTKAVNVAKKVKGVKSVDATGLTVTASTSDSSMKSSMPASGSSSH
jgi:hyperosmotically inducible periplasmic protein